MEEATSAAGGAVFTAMRALARRGAQVRRSVDGGGIVVQADEGRPPRRIEPAAFARMLDSGWLRQHGADSFVISRRGVVALKGMLSREAAAAAGRLAADAVAAVGRTASTAASSKAQAAATKPLLNPRESPIAWLHQRKGPDGKPMISTAELEAGERLRRDFEKGLMGARVTGSWDGAASASGVARGAPGALLEASEAALGARQRVNAALQAVGPEFAGILLDVCCYLQGLEQAERNGGWPRRAGKVVLQLGLAHLARHYGLDGSRQGRPGHIRGWGADGYRPSIDVEPDDDAASED